MPKSTLHVVVALGLIVAGCRSTTRPSAGTRLDTASAIAGPPYEELNARAGAAPFDKRVVLERATWGVSVGGRSLEVFSARVAKPVGKEPRRAVLITEAIHGNEYLGIATRIWTEMFPKDAATTEFLNAGGVLYYIPIVNPDGYARSAELIAKGGDRRHLTLSAAMLRGNTNGSDLNRQFENMPPSDESGHLARWANERFSSGDERLVLAANYHCCAGALMYGWFSDASKELPIDAVALTWAIGPLAFESLRMNVGNGPALASYSASGTWDDFLMNRFGTLSLAVEGTGEIESARYRGHEIFWKRVMGVMAGWQRTGAIDGTGSDPSKRPYTKLQPTIDLGFDMMPMTSVESPPLVTDVESGGAFEKAGIVAGDAVLKIDNHFVFNPNEIQSLARYARSEGRQQITVTVTRGPSRAQRTFTVSIPK